eukprot:snap_masked-scaffold444_size168727-processed-gene-0.25 protein:Tk11374 transcript:snap_masked-scaffold444_size168727-processed-gene-0.25-mRNA-1 annotation:"4-coumarate-- ligase-like"
MGARVPIFEVRDIEFRETTKKLKKANHLPDRGKLIIGRLKLPKKWAAYARHQTVIDGVLIVQTHEANLSKIMSVIGSNNILTSHDPLNNADNPVTAPDKHMVEVYFEAIQARIEKVGNARYCTDGLTGEFNRIGDLEPQARRLAKLFTSLGVKRGDIVQISIPNDLEFSSLVLGTWVCGAIPSMTDPDLSVTTLQAQVEDTKAKIIICTSSKVEMFLKAIKQTSTGAQIVVLDDAAHVQEMKDAGLSTLSQLLAGCDQLPDPEPVKDFSLDDTAFICWSSGTTGTPKGICLSYQLVKHRVKTSLLDLPSPDLLTTCMFHISGIGKLLMGPLNQEAIFFKDSDLLKDITLILKACHDYKCGKVFLGSHHCAQLANLSEIPSGLDLSSVIIVMPIGARVPDAMLKRLNVIFPNMNFLNCYSMTELGFLVANSMDPHCLGSLAEGAQVKIQDPVTQTALGPLQTGEILVKPPYPFPGYYNKPEETAKFCDSDGFCHTGDFGHYDEKGMLYLDGRMKEVIKYRNNHVYPMELENLIQDLPEVAEVGVYGKPDPASQELAVAVVRLVPGAQLTEEAIQKHVAENVDNYKQLRGGVRFTNAPLPKNAMGKPVRNLLATIMG